MPTINQLSATNQLQPGDLVPIYSSTNGDARKASMSLVKEFIQEDFVPAGGLLAISGIYAMRKTTSSTVAIGTSYANFANYETPLVFPAGRDSIAGMETVGEFVAQRDIAAVMFWVAITGTWPTNRDLTLAILVGADANPFESTVKFIGAGRGANVATAAFSAPVVNLNNPGGTIKAGEKIRLVAKMNTADNLDLQKMAFIVQTLDGI